MNFNRISFIILFLLLASPTLSAYLNVDTYDEYVAARRLLAVDREKGEVPRVFIRAIPQKIKELVGIERRRFFIDLILPIILAENEKIEAEHDAVMAAVKRDERSEADIRLINETAKKYNLIKEEDDFLTISDEKREAVVYLLDMNIRPVPPAIALGQAALESAWGTSRFTFEGNNLFGHVSKDPSKGLKPKNWSGTQRHIYIFDSITASISAYMLNLNRNRVYRKFRLFRQQDPKNLMKMAEGFDRYAIIKELYVGRLQTVMFKYGTHRYNDAKLAEPGVAGMIGGLKQVYITN